MHLKEKGPKIPKWAQIAPGSKIEGARAFWNFEISKNALKVDCFSWFFRKCWKFEPCCHLLSNMMYNSDLKLKPSRGAESDAKISRIRPIQQIWVPAMPPFCDFEISVMLPFSKNFCHLLPNRDHWMILCTENVAFYFMHVGLFFRSLFIEVLRKKIKIGHFCEKIEMS